MANVLILYYSGFGHIRTMAEVVAAGAAQVKGTKAEIAKIPEFEDETLRVVNQSYHQQEGLSNHFRLTKRKEDFEASQRAQEHIPTAAMHQLREADGIIWGFPTYLGSMPAQVKSFLDHAGQFCSTGELEGKPTALFTSAGSIHGGHEAALLGSLVPLLHLGMIYMGLPYTENPEYLTANPVGGSPYGASTLAGPDSSRVPAEDELTMASRLGKRVARVAWSFEQSKPFGQHSDI
ncbi:NAD(P)H:quinone oxidoreductase [Salibacterium aidingense]|uniref:NAD(P)H:quinone oxidoreductase n=1 Tax=Salibacterium aidingense TaxID=384933 RepID=UPI000408F3AD|nr:NAD(P)H:quinone oxidoreductase [Salibacterium aidingense]